MHSVIMPIGRNINENGGKKTRNKRSYSWQLTERRRNHKKLGQQTDE